MTKRLVCLHLIACLILPSVLRASAAELYSEASAIGPEEGIAAPILPQTQRPELQGLVGAVQAPIDVSQSLQGLSRQVESLPADGSLQSKARLDSFIENGAARGDSSLAPTETASGLRSVAAADVAPAPGRTPSKAPPLPVQQAPAPAQSMLSALKTSASRMYNRFFGKQDPPPQGSADERPAEPERLWVTVRAGTNDERTRVSELGLAIDDVDEAEGTVSGTAAKPSLAKFEAAGFPVLRKSSLQSFIPTDFPHKDAVYHNYDRMLAEMKAMAAAHPDFISLFSIGKSVEGRDLWGLRFNTDAKGLEQSKKPGFALFGAHHAREHLSVEVPLMIAKYLADSADPADKKLLAERDIYIIPMVNPDGAEFDIQGPKQDGSYQMWRKNRRDNGDGTFGVDLNRNYGYEWGTGGASADTDDETFRGPGPFSEPETQAVRDFLTAHRNITILDTKHSFSELHLYPDGYKYTPIENAKDAQIHEVLAKKMAAFTGYSPEQSSKLYIASGDLTDWSYHALGIYSFTTELTPRSEWGGGFYPGTKVIEKAYETNLKADLMLIQYADDPSRAIQPGS